ncbi:MAG: hypothetical protein IKV76_10495 [Clostridia bacterium]|nr:hypothetical protein [Clostridia bacterium]
MKKILAIILSIVAVATLFTACSDNDTQSNNENNEQVNQITPSDNNNTNDSDINKNEPTDSNGKIVNDDGETFNVDTNTKGTINTDAEGIDSNKFILNDVTYELPFASAELFNNGYYISENLSFEDEFDANAATNLISFNLSHNNKTSYITLTQVYNDSDSFKTLKECTVSAFDIDFYYVHEDDNFVIPGGITKESTAANILEIFGDPNTTTEFENGYNLDDQLTYNNHKTSNISYSFTFNENGTLYSIHIDYLGFES